MTLKQRVAREWRFYAIVIYFVVNSLIISYVLYQQHTTQANFQTAARKFAAQQRAFNIATIRETHNICVASNHGALTVYEVLNTIEQRVKSIQNPNQTPAQKAEAIKIYEDLKSSIKFTKCPPLPPPPPKGISSGTN